MELHANPCGFEDKKLEDHQHQKWVYVSERKMQKEYPHGGYRIMADFRKAGRKGAVGTLIGKEEQSAEIFTYSGKLPSGTKCLGYISVTDENGEEAFVRILQQSGKWIWITISVLLLLLTIGIAIWLIVINTNNKPTLDQAATAYHIEGVENKDPNTILMPTIPTIEIEEGTTHIAYPLVNTTGNPCYFAFRMILADTGETLYQSGLVEPRSAILEFDLNRKLEAGAYDMKLFVDTRSLSNPEAKMNNAELEFKLVVKEVE